MKRWSSARKTTWAPAATAAWMPRTSGCVVTHASQPRCCRVATTQAEKPSITPSPDDMGTAATRAPCSCTQRSPSVTVREGQVAQAQARDLAQPVLDGQQLGGQRRDVGLGQSCHRGPPSLGAVISSSAPACRSLVARQLGDHLRRPGPRLARGLRRRTMSVAAQLVASRRVVRERLVGAEEAGHQLQRTGRAHHVLAEDLQHTVPRRGRAGTRRRGAARGRPAAARRRSTVSASSSTMLRPLDQYTAVGVWLGRRASISSTLGSAPRTITSTSMRPSRPRPSASAHGGGVERVEHAGGRRRRSSRRRRPGRRPQARRPGLSDRRDDALAVVGGVELEPGDLQRHGAAAPGEHLERERRAGDVLLDDRPRGRRRSSAARAGRQLGLVVRPRRRPRCRWPMLGLTTAGKPHAGHGTRARHVELARTGAARPAWTRVTR